MTTKKLKINKTIFLIAKPLTKKMSKKVHTSTYTSNEKETSIKDSLDISKIIEEYHKNKCMTKIQQYK